MPADHLDSFRFEDEPILLQCLLGSHVMQITAPMERGTPVLKIQLTLMELGFPLDQFGPDGIYGQETATAVANFKLARGIFPASGKVGPKTMQRLDEDIATGDIIPTLNGITQVDDNRRLLTSWLKHVRAFEAGIGDAVRFPPFSSICKVIRTGGVEGAGTAFYIHHNFLLTAAHVIATGSSNYRIFPGFSPATDVAAGGFNVTPLGNIFMHPLFATVDPVDRPKFDLGLIRVSQAPPSGFTFGVQELLTSPEGGMIVSGYAASGGPVDGRKQHLDVDTVRTVTDENFTFGLQVRPGTSGSPAFFLDANGQYVAGGVAVSDLDAHLNQACRLTAAKLAWINSVIHSV